MHVSLKLTLVAACLLTASPLAWGQERGKPPLSANERMLMPTPQSKQLERMVGTWDVTMTLRPTPDATPIVLKGIVAERTMIGGQYLQEVMKPGPGSNSPDFTRIGYLLYNQADSRWEYSSIDTRIAGIMNRANFGSEPGSDITFYMMAFTMPGFGPEFEGKSVRLREVMKLQSDDRDELLQYWTPAGGQEWLAVHYEYTRRR